MDLVPKTKKEMEIDKRREYLVVKSNELIHQARNKFNLREMRLVSAVISMIKPGDPADTEYTLSVLDFARLCGCEQNYSHIKKMVLKIISKPLWAENLYGDGEDHAFVWFEQAVYNKRRGMIRFKFSRPITPFLFALKNCFTSYPLEYILPMRSSYSVKLYERLKCDFEAYPDRQYLPYNLKALREYLDANTGAYKTWDNFKRRVLEPAIGDINSKEKLGDINIYSDINVSYRADKRGRAVENIIFFVKKKTLEEIAMVRQKNQYILDGELLRPEQVKPYVPGQISMDGLLDDDQLIWSEDEE